MESDICCACGEEVIIGKSHEYGILKFEYIKEHNSISMRTLTYPYLCKECASAMERIIQDGLRILSQGDI